MTSRDPRFSRAFAALLALQFAASACAELLDLSPGRGSAAVCQSDDDCAPESDCKSSRCIPRSCQPDMRDCHGLSLVRCTEDHVWEEERRCDAICTNRQCRTPNSCQNDSIDCAGMSCCKAEQVDQTTFLLKFVVDVDGGGGATLEAPFEVERTVRAIALDRFEVTVSRFAAFVSAFESEGIPEPGEGEHPAFSNSGWDPEWTRSLSDDSKSLVRELEAHGRVFGPDVRGDLPIRGVSWFTAYAFCIWDGARLPTEAEWAAAAQGGAEGRPYPWSTDDVRIGPGRAVYSESQSELEPRVAPEPVGSLPQGAGRFEHQDLAGNIMEWVADAHQEMLPASCENDATTALDEHECLQREGEGFRVLRGGSYRHDSAQARNVSRQRYPPDSGLPHMGFRCARNYR